MSTLAHVFEAAGIATIVLAANRSVAERMQPPRTLFCEFPLGRPLGKPADPAFQSGVLHHAFELLSADRGPVLHDHPDVIESDETPLQCSLPPRFDGDLPASVDEANGLRNAYDRAIATAGVTEAARSLTVDQIPEALASLEAIAAGEPWTDTDFGPGGPLGYALDIRNYYEKAALELATNQGPAGRAAEAWFFDQTEAGATILAARRAMKEQGAPRSDWFYMAPGHR